MTHDVNNVYDKMTSQKFSYWRVVVDRTLAKKFVSQRNKQMISRCFYAIIIIYTSTDNNELAWAMDNPGDVC